MKIGIYYNPHKQESENVISELTLSLKKYGIGYHITCEINSLYKQDIDFLITVGGDGTMLNVVEYCAKNNITVAGINLGSVGFLTEIEKADIDDLVKIINDKSYKIESRTLLTTSMNNKEYIALNDIVLLKNNEEQKSRVVEINAYINNHLLDRYICDGIVICTPTGSTAYSLSCGGAVLHPTVNAYELVAICPHSLHSRPIVLPYDEIVSLHCKESTKLIIDGNIVGNVNDKIIIKTSPLKLKLLKHKENSFYNKLLEKLSKWSAKP